MRRLVLVGALLFLCACSKDIIGYSLNDAAKAAPIVHATFVARGTGAGPVTFDLATGEHFAGNYSVRDTGAYAVGSFDGSLAIASAYSGSRPGIATLQGDRGTTMECQMQVSPMGSGDGECQSSTGANYRVYF